ncbi:hypothetical protein BU17DRAFT_72793 [Hysterangium stoloniferum]|nr:hypothetical protein BU17DRAFT_72793 [Hysterangium stoloniferum]
MCDVLMEHFEKNWSIVRPRDGSSKYPQNSTVLFPLAAHHRIICVGNYVLNDDYPRGMLTEEELAEVSKAECLYSWIREFEDWDEDSGILPPAAMVPGSHDWRIFQEIVDKRSPLVRVVRNMSKKEYIRERGITAEAGWKRWVSHRPYYREFAGLMIPLRLWPIKETSTVVPGRAIVFTSCVRIDTMSS